MTWNHKEITRPNTYLINIEFKMLTFLPSLQSEGPVDPVWRVVHPGGQPVHDSLASWLLYVPIGQISHSQMSWSSKYPVPHPKIQRSCLIKSIKTKNKSELIFGHTPPKWCSFALAQLGTQQQLWVFSCGLYIIDLVAPTSRVLNSSTKTLLMDILL